MKIRSVSPGMALPAGIVRLEMEGLSSPLGLEVEIGGVRAEVIGASRRLLTVKVPDGAENGVVVRKGDAVRAPLKVGRVLAGDFHSVSNPVVDDLGNVYVTYSGARGEKVPFSVFVVYPNGRREPFLADITNPTGMVVGPDHCLYITSRHTGIAYKSTFDKQLEEYADGLGLATGVVFDSQGNLLVGDRSGAIRKVSPSLEVSVLCELEPSVSAYHLAIDARDNLFVTGPTLSTQDALYRVSPEGKVEVVFRGFGRPQGLVVDPSGNIQVAASYGGRKGIFTLEDSKPRLSVAGPMLVGLAYSTDKKHLYLTDSSNLYRLEC